MERSDAADDRPILIWDGDCGFCRRSAEYLKARLPEGAIEFSTYQSFNDAPQGLGDEDFQEAVHLLRADGSWSRGAEAVFEALSYAPEGGWALWLYLNLPGFSRVSESVYRWVANHRGWVGRTTSRLIGRDLGPRGFRFARRTFVRALGLIFVIAFASFGAQWAGLIGSDGVLPAAQRWQYLLDQPETSFVDYPSIFWLVTPTDAAIAWTWIGGAVVGALVVLGLAPIPGLFVCWALYLSLVNVGGPFFSFQWDALLLEAAFVAVLMTPWCWSLNGVAGRRRVGRAALLLVWWLNFRLYFMSGVAKLLSGDPVWHNMTALEYHFWTQPLPTWSAYYAAGLPHIVLSALTVGMFVIELMLPFLLFAPRRLRHVAAAGFASLQVGILATGNYGFFNLLALTLCIPMVDDGAWRWLLPFWPESAEAETLPGKRGLAQIAVATVVIAVVMLSAVKMGARFSLRTVDQRPIPDVVKAAFRVSGHLDGFTTVNNYGLFADMTVERPELIIEGSNDGKAWRRYDFRWKPDEPLDRPSYAVPHLPRLDWRLWFAALKGCRAGGWYRYLQRALLQGREDVEALLAEVPFETPPRYIKTTVRGFEFAGRGRSQTPDASHWWQMTDRRQVCGVVTLSEGKLRRARVQ